MKAVKSNVKKLSKNNEEFLVLIKNQDEWEAFKSLIIKIIGLWDFNTNEIQPEYEFPIYLSIIIEHKGITNGTILDGSELNCYLLIQNEKIYPKIFSMTFPTELESYISEILFEETEENPVLDEPAFTATNISDIMLKNTFHQPFDCFVVRFDNDLDFKKFKILVEEIFEKKWIIHSDSFTPKSPVFICFSLVGNFLNSGTVIDIRDLEFYLEETTDYVHYTIFDLKDTAKLETLLKDIKVEMDKIVFSFIVD